MSNKIPEEKFTDKEIVWVKLDRLWWPGEVCSEERLPDGLLSSLKSKPISIVRFFNEDQFEFVKSLRNICKYNNPKKHDFIKKGLDAYRTTHKHLQKFPDDIELAERLTNGDPNIIYREEFQPRSRKSVWADIFNEKKPSKPNITNKKTKTLNSPNNLNRSQPFRKSIDHEIRILTQPSTSQTNSYSSNTPGSSEQLYRCHLCDFSSKRVNVVMLHSKLHSPAGVTTMQQNCMPPIDTKESTLKRVVHNDPVNENLQIKNFSSDSSDNNDAICIIREDIALPKKRNRSYRNESLTSTKAPKIIKSRGRGKRKFEEPGSGLETIKNSEVEILNLKDELPIKIDHDSESDVEIIPVSKKTKTENKVEFKKKLLEDWVEDDSDNDSKSNIKSHIADLTHPDNSMNSMCEEIAVSKDQNEIKTNDGSKDNLSNSNTITKYRNIPKKDRKREFIFDEVTTIASSIDINKSQIGTENNITQNENDIIEPANETNLEYKTFTKEISPNDIKLIDNDINKIHTIQIEIIKDDDIQIPSRDGIDQTKDKTNCNVTPESIAAKTTLDDSLDTIKTQIPKASEITCFDFQDDDDLEFARSPPRRQRNRKSVNLSFDNSKFVNDVDRLNERDNDIKMQTDLILQITDPPRLPELPKVLSTERLSTSTENIVIEKKENSLPPKERGKRIFKSRNRNKLAIGSQSQIIKKEDSEHDIERNNRGSCQNRPTESDLQIAETLINIPSRTSNLLQSLVYENTTVNNAISDDTNSIIDNMPVHVSRKQHIQAAFKAEEEKNLIKEGTSQLLDNISNLPSKQSSQLVPAVSPKQKIVLKLNEDMIANNSNKFEPRTPKKRKTSADDGTKEQKEEASLTDENVFDINNMEIVISDEVIQNEPMDHIQSSIEPIVIQTISEDIVVNSSDEIKENENKKSTKNHKTKIATHPITATVDPKKKLPISSDTKSIRKPKATTKRSGTISPGTTNISSFKKSQIIQATAGGQIVITSKGQLLTTNSQSQLTSSSQTCETTTSCAKSISSTKTKESATNVQVQSQRIIYPSNKIKSNKAKLIEKINTESPSKVKMSLQSLTEMTKLGYIKEKGTERIITATGLKRIKQHLLTGSKDRIPPLSQSPPKDSNLTTTSPVSQLMLQLPASPRLSETTVPGDPTEPVPQILSTTSTLPSTSCSTSEITENYYACAAESFGGPPNSFYLCRAGENNTFIPIDNRALYLDANNRLVEDMPDIINTFDTIANQNTSSTAVLNCEQVAALELNSNSNENIQIQDVSQSFIINTQDGQQIILDQQSFLSLAAGEMPHLITADGQQIIFHGSPQDIITAITVNQQEMGLITEEQNIIIPQSEGQTTLGNNDIISVALEGSQVYQRPESLIGNVIIPNTPHADIVANQSILPTATATVLSNPIMSTLEVPTKATTESNNLTLESGLNIDDSLAAIGVNTAHSNVPSSLELPITVTNPAIASKTSPLSLNTIYTPTISSIGAIGQISEISPSLGYDIFDTSSSSSSSKGTGAGPDRNGNVLSSNISISELNCNNDNLNLNNRKGNENNIEDELETENIIPQSPEIEINISSVNDPSGSPIACVNYDENSDNSDEIPIQPNCPNLIIYNNENNNIDNNGHELIDVYDNDRKSQNDDVKQSSENNNINNDKDDRR